MRRDILRSAALLAAAGALLAALSPAARAQDGPPRRRPQQSQPAQPVLPDQVDKALSRGVEYLFSRQRPLGDFNEKSDLRTPAEGYPGANDAMAMLGLTTAGVTARDERLLRGLDALMRHDLDRVYTVSLRTMVLSRLLRQVDARQRAAVAEVLSKDVEALQKSQNSAGGWHYNARRADRNWDFSNTQMAILGLSEAEAAGGQIKPDVFIKAQKLYLERQRPDGGWNYGTNDRGASDRNTYGSMTASAVASLFITRDILYHGMGCPCKNEQSDRKYQKLDEALDRGLEWLDWNFTAARNPSGDDAWKLYWLYACERAALASGFKLFGTHDWYAEGAAEFLKAQAADGSWGSIIDTSFALSFLAKGRAPVLFNKLRFKGQWNNHPRDLANLADFVSQQKSSPVKWQVMNLDAPLAEWHDAPVLCITAETPIDLNDNHKKQLRRFTDTGGTIFFEASCANRKVADWWRKTCAELWPEWELRKIEKDHDLWSCDTKMLRLFPALFGLSDGLRTPVFFSTADISCAWNVADLKLSRLLFDLGANLYFYTTDRTPLDEWRADREAPVGLAYADQAKALKKGPRQAIGVARVRHGDQWNLAANYEPWQLLATDLQKKVAGLAVKELPPVAAPEALPEGTNLLYLCGRSQCDLGEGGPAWLKARLADGAFLFAEAVMGDPMFEEPFKATLAAAGLETRPLEPDNPLVTGKLFEARGYEIAAVEWSQALRAERKDQPQPVILGIYDGRRLVGFYSPCDIMFSQTGCKAFGNRGYAADDARALVSNLLLLLTTR